MSLDDKRLVCETREKYWEELSDAEKVERLGDRLVYLQRIVNSIAQSVEKMSDHDHVGGRMFYGNSPLVSPLGWPNDNILGISPDGREKRQELKRFR